VSFDFETLLSSSPNPYVLIDRDLVIVWMNDAYLRVTGRSRDEIVDRPMFEAFPSDPASESYRLLKGSLERVFRTGQTDELALIRYDIQTPAGQMDARYWSATHTPHFDDEGNVKYVLQHTVDVTELHGLRRMRDEMRIVERANRIQSENLDLTEQTERLKTMFEQAPGFVALLTGPEHRFTLANAAYRQLVGGRDVIGQPVAQALPEVVEQGFVQLLDTVTASGQPYVGRQVKVMLARGGEEAERFLDFIYQPIVGRDGLATGVLVQGHDVTEQVEAQEVQRLLVNELNHRVKNTLAIVQALAAQSFRNLEGADDARRTLEARLHALASAHALLTSSNWESARLADTIRKSTEATAGADVERIALIGPDIVLPPQAAVSLAMIVHELTTNAIKYGALSVPAGKIEVRWSVGPNGTCERMLVFDWKERGGPSATEPQRPGFGTRLIKRGLSSERSATAKLSFTPEGFEYHMTMELPEIERAPGHAE
jgi:PAS domain S-box-containing protein